MGTPPENAAPPSAISGNGESLSNAILPHPALGMTTAEVAEACRVSQRTVRDWARLHGLPAVRVGRTVRFRPEAVAAWLRSREGGAA